MNVREKDIEIAVLHQISKAVLHEHNISLLLRNVLDVLHREIGFDRGTFTLLRDDILFIEASHGLNEDEIKRGKYHLGEGITGRVGELGKPILIPDITKDPNFLNRTKTRDQLKDVAFLCVPIIYMERVIGTLSMDRKITPETDLDRDMRFLETIANMMADAVELCRQKHSEKEKLLMENQHLREELGSRFLHSSADPLDFIGNCSSMRAVRAQAGQVADTQAPVLIRGASGTGKERLARLIHQGSPRRDNPFIEVDCASIPENLLETEIFGYEKTGGPDEPSLRPGRMDAAAGGTLYIDEAALLPLPAQVRLLHFLENKKFSRPGSEREVAADVRILVCTGRNLEQMMEDGKFKDGLYYRLNVFPIHLPDLRNRSSDIILLAEHFLEKYSALYKKKARRISPSAINLMMSYHWPGNVRELENCMERAVLTAAGDVIAGYHLPPSLQTGMASDALPPEAKSDFTSLVHAFERELIMEALKNSRGNVSAAARALNLTDRILHYRIQKLHITPEWYRIGSGD